MPRRWPPLLAVVLILAATTAARAQASFQTVASIRAAAQAVVAGDAGVVVDEALRMPACSQPLIAAVANARNVQVRCPDAPGWQLYVPVRTAATAPVGRRLPMAGTAPQAQAAASGADYAVQRGDPVVLVSRAGGIEVRMSGRALGPANAAGQVNVENAGSRRIIRGRLVAAGVVEVGL